MIIPFVDVYHVKNPTFNTEPAKQFPQGYVRVARVNTEKVQGTLPHCLEFTFLVMQNNEGSWAEHPEVTPYQKGRSTSVGDVLCVPGRASVVDVSGFTTVQDLK